MRKFAAATMSARAFDEGQGSAFHIKLAAPLILDRRPSSMVFVATGSSCRKVLPGHHPNGERIGPKIGSDLRADVYSAKLAAFLAC